MKPQVRVRIPQEPSMPCSTPESQRKYQREWLKRRRLEWFEKNGPCKQCGSKNDLQLDHIDPSSKIHHVIWSWSKQRREEELLKCQVLCKKCHHAKSLADGAFPYEYKHGTKNMYEIHKCRCELCKAWRAARQRRYIAKKKQMS